MNKATMQVMTSIGKDDWEPPSTLFQRLDSEFGFTIALPLEWLMKMFPHTMWD